MSKKVEVEYRVTTQFQADKDVRELDRQVAAAIDWQNDVDLAIVRIERLLPDGTRALVMNKTADETIMPVPCMGCGEPIEVCVRADRKPFVWHSECFEKRKES